jgi:hypothetical protein
VILPTALAIFKIIGLIASLTLNVYFLFSPKFKKYNVIPGKKQFAQDDWYYGIENRGKLLLFTEEQIKVAEQRGDKYY